jgi:hypothetical protein
VLTDLGKTVARLILTKKEPPDWLKHALEQSDNGEMAQLRDRATLTPVPGND